MGEGVNIPFSASLGGGTKAVFSSLANGIKEVATGLKKLAKEQVALGNKGAASALNEMAKGLKKVTKENKDFANSSKQVETSGSRLKTIFTSLGTSMKTYSRYMVSSNILLGIIGSFKASASAVIEYDQALHDLVAITLSSTAQTAMMGEEIVRVAALTKFSMGEVGGAMKKLGQAGFSSSEIVGMIGGIAELATGSLESLETTVSLVSTAMRVFKLDVSETQSVVDIFANAVTKSRLTISGLNTTFNYIGPIAAATGLSLKDTSASMMLLANAGLRFSTIGTGLRRIIGGLAKPTSDFKNAILSAGYTMADFNPNITDFRDILLKLPKVIKDSTDAIRFFGYRGSSVISALATQGVNEYDRLRAATDRVGTASEMAVEQMKGLQNAIKNVKDRFGVLAKTIAEGGLLDVFKFLVDSVRSLETVLIALVGNPLGQTVILMGLLATSITLASLAIATLINSGLAAKLGVWIPQIVSIAAGFFKIEAASFAAAAGTVTFTSVLRGLIGTMWAFASNPMVIALSGIILGLTGVVWWVKAHEKALRDLMITQEKYSSSLGGVTSKIKDYSFALENYGRNSKQTTEAAKRLRASLVKLGDKYTDLKVPLQTFIDNIDEHTGVISENKETIEGLNKVIGTGYKVAILIGIAASEKLVEQTNKSIHSLENEIEKTKELIWIKNKLKGITNWFKNLAGVSIDEDPLNAKGIILGEKALVSLELQIKNGSVEAAESLKILKSGGEQMVEYLKDEGLTREKLVNLTEDQIKKQIISSGKLLNAHKGSVAWALRYFKTFKDAEGDIDGINEELKRQAKAIADANEAYGYFGLNASGVSQKLKISIDKLKDLTAATGDQEASSDQLTKAFIKLGAEVKSVKDYELYTKALEDLNQTGRLTDDNLYLIRKAFNSTHDSVYEASVGMKKESDDWKKKIQKNLTAIGKATLKLKDEWIKNNTSIQEDTEKRNAAIIKANTKAASKRLKIEEDLKTKLDALDLEKSDLSKRITDDIVGLEEDAADKILSLKQKSMSDEQKQRSFLVEGRKKFAEGEKNIATAKATNDKVLLERGKKEIEQAGQYYSSLTNIRTVMQNITKVKEAQIEASKVEKQIEEAKIEVEITKEKEKARVLLLAVEVEKQAKLAASKLVFDDSMSKEKIRHDKVIKNLDAEILKLKEKMDVLMNPSTDDSAAVDIGIIDPAQFQLSLDDIEKMAKEADLSVPAVVEFTASANPVGTVPEIVDYIKNKVQSISEEEPEVVVNVQQSQLLLSQALISGILEKIKDGFRITVSIFGMSNLITLSKYIKGLKDKTITITTRYVTKGKKASGGSGSGYAQGGRIPGFGGGDKNPILAENGEWIINKYAVQKFGDSFMASINNMTLPKFATGGKVGNKIASSPRSEETLIVRFQAGDVEAPIKITDVDSRMAMKNMASELTKMKLVYAR